MSIACPRCYGPVERTAGRFPGGGLVGALVMLAFAGHACAACGPIPREEFPPDVRTSMTLSSLGLVGGAIVLLVLVIGFVAMFNG